jgi:ubiquinone/menaquinone biosynthesis C-methylase UbiE
MKSHLFLLFAITAIEGFAQDPWKDVYRESAWKQRDSWQRPEEIIRRLNIKAGDKVADVGCHEGYFTIKLSEKVGPKGTVYAVDVSKDKIEKLKNNLEERKITNVNVILGEENNPHLPTLALDAVLIVDTYHEMDEHQEILQRIKNALRLGGRLVVCEPISSERKNSSRAEQERKHELGINYALEDLKKEGYKIIFQQESFVDRMVEKGDRMWIIVAEKVN